jgi:hypothetical protein
MREYYCKRMDRRKKRTEILRIVGVLAVIRKDTFQLRTLLPEPTCLMVPNM